MREREGGGRRKEKREIAWESKAGEGEEGEGISRRAEERLEE